MCLHAAELMVRHGAVEEACSGSDPGFAISQLYNLRPIRSTSGLWFSLGVIEPLLSGGVSRSKQVNVWKTPSKFPFPAHYDLKHSLVF